MTDEATNVALGGLPRYVQTAGQQLGVGGGEVRAKAVIEFLLLCGQPSCRAIRRCVVVRHEVGVDVGRVVDETVGDGHGRLEVLVTADE